VAGKLGLRFAIINPSATAIWPPTGIALAAFLAWGYEVWPSIFIGAFLVNWFTAGSVLVCFGIALGNTLEAVAAAYCVRRFARGQEAFYRAPDIFRFALLAGVICTLISATAGVASLGLGHLAETAQLKWIWLTWWLGDMGGALIVAPVIVLWNLEYVRAWDRRRTVEFLLMLGCVLLSAEIVFSGLALPRIKHYPLEFICLPALLWAAFRLGPRDTATAIFVLCAVAVRGTLHREGPFARHEWNVSLLLLHAFMAVISIMTLAVAAVVRERQEMMEEALRTSESRFRRLVQSNIIGFMMVNLQGKILEANDAFLDMLRFSRQDLESGLVGGPAMTPHEYHVMDEWTMQQLKTHGVCSAFEKEYVRKDGSRIPVIVGVVRLDPPEDHFVCFVIDATERRLAQAALRKAYDELELRVNERTQELSEANTNLEKEILRRKAVEDELRNLSLHDVLTGLHNRRGFLTYAAQHLKLAHRKQRSFLLFFADVDRLKEINDTLGHLAGDAALMETATVLQETFRESDIVARIGGDEFAMIAGEAKSSDITAYLARLQKRLEEINQTPGRSYRLAMSIGAAVYDPGRESSLSELMRQADEELYKRKSSIPVGFSVRTGL
jgi:diguanylate cyclase (GGDEF)-like protein/PAS domain S-box-containing protein